MSSPTQRTLALLRKRGYRAEVVERYVRTADGGFRKDLFSVIDVLAIKPGEVLGVQACSYGDVSRRVQKIADNEATPDILEAGIALHVHGWKKVKNRWQCREVDCS